MGSRRATALLTIVYYCREEMVDAMHSNVDGEQEAHEDLIRKHNCCLDHMEAVARESCGHIRPAQQQWLKPHVPEVPSLSP